MLDNYEELSKRLHYCPDTGLFTWIKPYKRVSVGSIAGFIRQDGYVIIKKHYAHRLAWYIMNGPFKGTIDHINGDTSDNRINNLRLVSHKDNLKNIKKAKNNTTGVTGVYYNKNRNKYVAQIMVNKTLIYLGCFNTLQEAEAARLLANKKYGFHKNHGRSKL